MYRKKEAVLALIFIPIGLVPPGPSLRPFWNNRHDSHEFHQIMSPDLPTQSRHSMSIKSIFFVIAYVSGFFFFFFFFFFF
jgi:hypothetical protein